MKRSVKIFAAAVCVSCMLPFLTVQATDYTILIEDIEIEPGVTIDINLNVYVNEGASSWGNEGKIYAVEGMSHTANCWANLAEALFLHGNPGTEINEIFAIDMPGRGGSGIPEGSPDFLYEDLFISHYLTIHRAVLSYLNSQGIYPTFIMGHSLGGLSVILLQEQLVQEGSSMRQYGIRNAICLAPAVPSPLPWGFLAGGAGGLTPFAIYTPELGLHLAIPYTVWPFIFFTNQFYVAPNMVPGAPMPPQVLANGYNSVEPGPLLFEMAGLTPPPPYPYKPRIDCEPDIFRPMHNVQLIIISDEYDKMMHPDEMEVLYEYLTGDESLTGYSMVPGEETCHDTHIADPEALVEVLNSNYYFLNFDIPIANWAIGIGVVLILAAAVLRFRRII
jgi:pimeloyl-ACP methyl ester carboxylesterase